MMNLWEDALNLPDPAAPDRTQQYIDFFECDDCPTAAHTSYVVIEYQVPGKIQNMCSYIEGSDERVGMNPNGETTLRLMEGQGPNTMLHELGHCLGLWHEFNRRDADRWLVESDAVINDPCKRDPSTTCIWDPEVRDPNVMPLLANYDYDSIMHYRSYQGTILQFTDRLGNAFSRVEGGQVIFKRDQSRVLQYYAREHGPGWGFFESLSVPRAGADLPPNPYLDLEGDPDIKAVGTPAIVFQGPGNYDIFARGSNNQIYWSSIRSGVRHAWTSLGCCAGSDPAAVSRSNGTIDVVVIGASTGNLIRIRYENESWGRWHTVEDGSPPRGIKGAAGGDYIGPAIASRGPNSLDVFVVRSDGLLAVRTLNNDAWTEWRTLGRDYNVTARPAAVALSQSSVQLAVNERGMYLYEGALTFAPSVPAFGLKRTAVMSYLTPPALATTDYPQHRYRVLITNADGRISHRWSQSGWRDIGGIPMPGTGPAAVATGGRGMTVVMNGEDATGCDLRCVSGTGTDAANVNPVRGKVIQPGGLWLRELNECEGLGAKLNALKRRRDSWQERLRSAGAGKGQMVDIIRDLTRQIDDIGAASEECQRSR